MIGSSITLEDYTLEENVRIFRDHGFDRVEMWKYQIRRCKTDELRQKFAAYAQGMGIAMGGLNAVDEEYYEPFGTDGQFQSTLDGLKGDVDIALSLGTRDVLVWEGRAPEGTTESERLDRCLPRLIELFQEAIAYAAPKGVRFLVEPHPFTVGMSDRFLSRLCDTLGLDHFGVTFDFCHYGVGRPQDYVKAVHALGPRIRHIHFSDSDQKSSELHFPPGQGRMDIQALLKAFKEIHYDGTMALDLYAYPIPVQAFPQAVKRLREALDFLGLKC